MVEIVGGSLIGLTVRTNELLELKLPSLTMMVTVAVPKRFVAGTNVAVRELPLGLKEMFPMGRSVGLDELADNVSELIGLSMSARVKLTVVKVSSSIAGGFGIFEIVGASFTAATLIGKLAVVEAPSPSVTVMVMVVVLEPNWLGDEVIVRVRFWPEPPGTILAFGIKAGLEDVALN